MAAPRQMEGTSVGKRAINKTLPALLLALAALLQGCLRESVPDAVPAEPYTPATTADIYDDDVSAPDRRGVFTLRYDPNSTLNPISGMNSDNILLSSLLYEGLFSLDSNLAAEPVLCESWTVEDNLIYTLNIKPDVAVNDGSTLTANDVVYTLTQASQRGLFVNRLKNVEKITSDGELSVIINLKSPNRHFINLLDIPIIKSGSMDNRMPPGTGPYVFSESDIMRLDRFRSHRDYESLPVYSIFLRVCNDDEAAEFFEDGKLSLLWDDPSDTYDIRLNRVHEKRFYDTTTLQFIGYNTRSVVLREPDVRRAVGCAIDREFIVSDIMQGSALVAENALSPAYRYYSEQWNYTTIDPQLEISAILDWAGLEDFDDDSYLEYPDGAGNYVKFSFDFIVNSENQYKVRAAHLIAGALRQTGISVTVRELPWDSFIGALESGNFDMYYGEVMLSADFDLSSLLLPNGKLNYGKVGGSDYRPYMDAFLNAETEGDEILAAKELCEIVLWESPFSPILYKKYAVYTPMGAISGAMPGQSGVFRMIKDWTIDLSMIF